MHSLTEKQADIVELVALACADGEDASISRLAEATGVTKTAARDKVEACIRKGYLRRGLLGFRPIRLTEKGRHWVGSRK